MTERSGSSSAAATAAESVRAIIEAAERTGSELEAAAREEASRIRTEAERETEAQLRQAHALADRLSARAEELERALADVGERIAEAIASLREDLRELRPGATTSPGDSTSGASAPGDSPRTAEIERASAEAPSPGDRTGATPAPADSAEAAETGEASAEGSPSEPEPAAPSGTTASPAATASEPPPGATPGSEGARVIALNMALNGSTREETARYLGENFELEDPDGLLDDVYSRAGG